jgi:hypothetical protein
MMAISNDFLKISKLTDIKPQSNILLLMMLANEALTQAKKISVLSLISSLSIYLLFP